MIQHIPITLGPTLAKVLDGNRPVPLKDAEKLAKVLKEANSSQSRGTHVGEVLQKMHESALALTAEGQLTLVQRHLREDLSYAATELMQALSPQFGQDPIAVVELTGKLSDALAAAEKYLPQKFDSPKTRDVVFANSNIAIAKHAKEIAELLPTQSYGFHAANLRRFAQSAEACGNGLFGPKNPQFPDLVQTLYAVRAAFAPVASVQNAVAGKGQNISIGA